MKINKNFSLNISDFAQISLLSVFAIGNFFDSRLEILDLNVSIIFSFLFFLSFIYFFATKSIKLSSTIFILGFFLMILIQNIIN